MKADALTAGTLRELVSALNEYGIKKESIVSFIKDGDHYTVLYYRQ